MGSSVRIMDFVHQNGTELELVVMLGAAPGRGRGHCPGAGAGAGAAARGCPVRSVRRPGGAGESAAGYQEPTGARAPKCAMP